MKVPSQAPSLGPSSSPEKDQFLLNPHHSKTSFHPSPIASPSQVRYTAVPLSASPPYHSSRPNPKAMKSTNDSNSVLKDLDTTSDEPTPCTIIPAISKPSTQSLNEFKAPLPKKKGARSRKRKRNWSTPPGLDIVKKCRRTENSLWTHKFERQQHLYKGTNESWLGAKQRPTGSEWCPNSSNAYKNLKQIGSGVYGSVFRGEAPSGKPVALKFLRLENERDGLPITAVREIKLLKHMNHKNVIKLLDMVTNKRMGKDARRRADIYMVLEWCDHDLSGLLNNSDFKFKETTVKHFMQEIMAGFRYLHSVMGTLHRDVKPANILVNADGEVKLADFGLSRVMDQKRALTNGQRIVTRWYRSPELLLESKKYDYAIDMWSVGCVFGELITGKPLFPAREEIMQLQVITDICGSIDFSDWPEAQQLNAARPKKRQQRRLKIHFREVMEQKRWNANNIEAALDLLDKLLQLSPKKRMQAADACNHPYFKTKPLALTPSLPTDSHHEWKYNKNSSSLHQHPKRHSNRSHRQPLPHHHRRSHHKHQGHSNFNQDFNQRFKPAHTRKQPNDHYNRHERDAKNNNNRRRNHSKKPRPPLPPPPQPPGSFFDYGAIDYGI